MAHSFPELKKKPLAELREIAAGIEHEAVKPIANTMQATGAFIFRLPFNPASPRSP